MELPPELLEPDDVDVVEEVPPEDPDEDDPDGTADPVDTAPAGAVCCAFAAGAAPTAMTPMRPAARRYRFMPSSTLSMSATRLPAGASNSHRVAARSRNPVIELLQRRPVFLTLFQRDR
jgi:hypothetical protein